MAVEQPVEFREAVLNALSEANQRILVNMLETAEWKLEGNEVVIKVASSATVIEMSLGRRCQAADDCDRQRSAGASGEAEGGTGRSGSDAARPLRYPVTAAAGAGRSRIQWSGG